MAINALFASPFSCLASFLSCGLVPQNQRGSVSFLNSPFCTSIQQSHGETSIVEEAEMLISPPTVDSVDHNAMQPQDMLHNGKGVHLLVLAFKLKKKKNGCLDLAIIIALSAFEHHPQLTWTRFRHVL